MFAYIPARGGSKRVPRKNIYPIAGKPMILHAIDHLLKVEGLSGIAVSTDDDEIISIVSNYNSKVHVLGKRSSEFANDSATFMDLVNHDIARFVEFYRDTDVLFVLPTSVLVTTSYYEQALKAFQLNSKGLLMSVVQNDQSPFLSFVQSGESISPLFPDKFLLPTKDLPQAFFDCGCFYAFNFGLMKGRQKFLDLTPVTPLVLPRTMGIDVDNYSDIEKLNEILGRK